MQLRQTDHSNFFKIIFILKSIFQFRLSCTPFRSSCTPSREKIAFLLLISILLFGLTSITCAERPILLTLHDAIFLALRYNPNVQSAEAQRIIDRYSLRVAYWNYDLQYGISAAANYSNNVAQGLRTETKNFNAIPTVSLLTPIGTQLNLQMTNPVTSPNVNTGINPAIVFSVSQPLLQGFGTDVNLAPLHQAQNQECIKQLTLKNTIMQTVTTVITQYAAVAQAENSIAVQRLSLNNSEATLQQQKGFLKIGRIAPADLIQFQSSLASQILLLKQQEVNLEQQKRSLLTTLNIDPSCNIVTTNKIAFENDCLPSLEKAIELGLKYNINYQQELINLRLAQIGLTLAKDQQKWQLNLTASHTRGGGIFNPYNSGITNLVGTKNYNSSVGVTLTIPIDNLSIKQQLVQAEVGLHQNHIRLAAQKRQVINEIVNAYTTVLNQRQQIVQAKIAVKLAKESLDVAQAKLKYGRSTSFEVSTLQATLTTQELALINTVTAYVTNLAALDQIIGITLDRWKIRLRI